MSVRRIAVNLVVMLSGFLLFLSPAKAGTTYQNFNNNSYNTQEFFLTLPTPVAPVATVTNDRLELTVPTSPGELAAAGLGDTNDYLLVGDYDIQIDFNLLTWPANNGVNAGIVTQMYEVTRVSTDFGQGIQEAYLVSFIGQTPTGFHPVVTSDNSGKLRLSRTGNTVSGYFWHNSGWQLIASNTNPQYGAPISFYVGGYVGNRAAIQTWVAFDNLKVTDVSFKGAAGVAPAISLLLN